MSTDSITPREIRAAVTHLESWRAYPEARADFITYTVGQRLGEGRESIICLQWSAYVFGWVSHKAHANERQILTTREANRAEIEKLPSPATCKHGKFRSLCPECSELA